MELKTERVGNVWCRYAESPCVDILQIAQIASLAAVDTDALVTDVFHDEKSNSFSVEFTNFGGDFESRFRLYYKDIYAIDVETAGSWDCSDCGAGGVWCGVLLERKGLCCY
jgi:hypothetical protein